MAQGAEYVKDQEVRVGKERAIVIQQDPNTGWTHCRFPDREDGYRKGGWVDPKRIKAS